MLTMPLPNFHPSTPVTSALSSRISSAMGVDYSGYIHFRQTDKNMNSLIGTSINGRPNDPVWGRPVTDNASGDRPPVDRSSGLYSSRRSAMSRERVSTPATNSSNSKAPTPVAAGAPATPAAAVAVKGTTPKTSTSVSNAEETLRSDLYLTSDEDEGPADGPPGGKEAKLAHRAADGARQAAATEEPPKGVKDLNYWIRTAKMKAPSASNSDGAGSPDKSGGEVEVKKEEEAVTPKSTYRELVKNGLDSLGGQRPARRSMRMLSGLPDSDDEAPVVAEKPTKRPKQPPQQYPEFRHHTPLSSVSNNLSEWKQRRKSRSPGPRPHPKSRVKGFVDRKISRSPKRELVPYNDLDNDASDSSLSSDPVKLEPVAPKFSVSPVPLKRRKYEKVEETVKPQTPVKLNGSPSRRPRHMVKTEPKQEPVESYLKPEVFDKSEHGFQRDSVHNLMVHFKVPPLPPSLPSYTEPSHRKRKRREDVSPMKVEAMKESSSNGDNAAVPPTTHHPVQSSYAHSNSRTGSQTHPSALTCGIVLMSGTLAMSNVSEVSSPDTDPMVDPTFDDALSDADCDYEIDCRPLYAKKSPEHRSYSSHRHRSSLPSQTDSTASLKASGARVASSLDYLPDNDGENSAALRAPVNTSEHKLGHTNGASNLVGQSLPVDSKRETMCKKSPDNRAMAQPSSPVRGERGQPPMMQIKTSPVHETTTIKSEPISDSLKPKPFGDILYKSMPKIPRKRPPVTGRDELPESKKKKKQSTQEQLPLNPDEPVPRDFVKKEKDGSKKSKDRSKIKRIKSEPTDTGIKREPSSPTSASSGRFEVSISDTVGERSFSPSPADNAAPFLPPATASASSAGVTEIGTQCELLPTAERDIAESITHTKRMAVAFRIEGGRGSTPIVSGESRNQPQTPRSSGGLMMQGSLEMVTGPAGGVPRRRSSASVDDGDATQSTAGPEAANDSHNGRPRADPNELLMDAVCRHRSQQEKVIQNENIAYQRMNSTQCFSEAAAKKHEADRLKNEEPARFALGALRACYLFIQACYVEERQGKLDNASMHYRETVTYVRSTAQMIEQVTKVPSNSQLLGTQKARVRHNFITLLCTEMKAMLNYRIYFLGHRDTARLRQEVERELSRCGAGSGANGASERSTPESLTRSPATTCGSGSSGASLHLMGEGHHKLMRYLNNTKSLMAAQEYWQHAQLLRNKHGVELKKIEERVFRRARHEFHGPDTPVPSFLRYLNTFLTLHEHGEL